MTESTEVENPVIRWLDKYKIKHRKMNGTGQRGWPDRLVCLPISPLWLEFKRKGEKLRKLQVYRVKQLRELGYDVQVYDTAKEAIAAIEDAVAKRVATAWLSKEGGKIHAAECMWRAVFGSRVRKDKHIISDRKSPKKRKTLTKGATYRPS